MLNTDQVLGKMCIDEYVCVCVSGFIVCNGEYTYK